MSLRSMRKGFLSAIFLALLVLGAFSLILSDQTGTLRGNVGGNNIAEVDGTPIRISEFNTQVSNILRSQKIDPASAYQMGLVQNILDNEIDSILLTKDATQLGIRIEDKIIAKQVKTLIAPLQGNGMSDKDALKKLLEMQGITEKYLTSALRDELSTKILKSTIAGASYAPQTLAADLQSYKNISKNIDYVFYPNTAITIKDNPSDADLKSYYNSVSMDYMTDETRDVTVAILDTAEIAKPTISEEDMKSFYEDHLDDFKISESADLEQSVLNDEKTAKSVLAAVKSGKKLQEAVRTVTGNTKSYTAKQNYTKDGLPDDISAKVFAEKLGNIVGPIKSPLGYHVITISGLKAERTASFDEVKNKIRKELEADKSSNAVFDVTTAIEDRLANGEAYEDLKKDYPLSLISLKNLTYKTAYDKNAAWSENDFKKIIAKSLTGKEGESSEFNDIEKGKLFSIRINTINKSTPKSFASVKDLVMKRWIASNQNQENLISVQKKVDDLNQKTITLPSLNPLNIPALTNKGDASIANDVIKNIMGVDIGKFVMVPSRNKNGLYIVRVNSVSLPKAVSDKDGFAAKNAESEIANTNIMTYMQSLKDKYPVEINDALIERVYDKKD